MVSTPKKHWASDAIVAIKAHRIAHKKYIEFEKDFVQILHAAEPGEVVVVVGPSRSGKSKGVKRCKEQIVRPSTADERPWVTVVASNDSRNSKFETKSFFCRALEAVEHPIYGLMTPDDSFGIALGRRQESTPG